MQMPEVSLIEWQKRFGTERKCAQTLAKVRWPKGFQCPACGGMKAYPIASRYLYQCAHCRHQVSITPTPCFTPPKFPWSNSSGPSTSWLLAKVAFPRFEHPSTWVFPGSQRKIRQAMAHRDSIYRLSNLIELDDTVVGGKRSGKRGRGADGKRPALVAVETREKGAGFLAMQAVDSVCTDTVSNFLARHLRTGQTVKTDALPALNVVAKQHQHQKKVTPPEEAHDWVPLVHIMIGNMKKFINGTFHGVSSRYLQEYLDEFCYRFNRRFWEPELPLRLLNACLAHTTIKIAEFHS
jgi:transposase-like protein